VKKSVGSANAIWLRLHNKSHQETQVEQSLEDRKLYAHAEGEARATRRGLWADVNPRPPWEFRQGR